MLLTPFDPSARVGNSNEPKAVYFLADAQSRMSVYGPYGHMDQMNA